MSKVENIVLFKRMHVLNLKGPPPGLWKMVQIFLW